MIKVKKKQQRGILVRNFLGIILKRSVGTNEVEVLARRTRGTNEGEEIMRRPIAHVREVRRILRMRIGEKEREQAECGRHVKTSNICLKEVLLITGSFRYV